MTTANVTNQSEHPVSGIKASVVKRAVYSKLTTKRMADLQMRYRAILNAPRTSETRKQLRNLRDLQRAVMAAERKRFAWHCQTKLRRETIIATERALKNSFNLEGYDDDLIYSESGLIGGVATTVAAVSAASVAMSVGKLADKFGNTAVSATSALNAVEIAINDSRSGLETIMDTIRNFVEHVKETFSTFWILPIGLAAYAIFRALLHIPIIANSILAFFRGVLVDSWQYLKGFFVGVESQAGPVDCTCFFATLAACVFVPGMKPCNMVGEIMRRVGQAERTSSGLMFLFENGLRYFEKTLNVLLGLVTDKKVSLTNKSEKVLDEWVSRVSAFELITAQRNPTLTELQGAMKLIQEGIGFRQLLKTTHNLNYLNKVLDRLIMAVQAHRGSLNDSSAFRMSPLTVMLGGGSGVGKTTVLKWLAGAAMMLTESVKADELLANMWQKGISEYWNGYVQQFVYIMDDCFQQKTDGKQLDNEAMFMIRAVGNWAFPLNFADLDSKGRFYFMSNMIMGTTNVADIEGHVAAMVAEPKAVTRRIEHGYWVSVHPDFKKDNTEMLDYKKMFDAFKSNRAKLGDTFTKEQLLNCIPWNAWMIVPHSFDRHAPPPVEQSFNLLDLAKRLADIYKERRAAHDEEVSDLTSWAQDLAKCMVQSESGSAVLMRSHMLSLETSVQDDIPLCVMADSTDFSFRDPKKAAMTNVERCKQHYVALAEEREVAAKYHYDWVAKFLNNAAAWCEGKGLPSMCAYMLKMFRDIGTTESDEGVHIARNVMCMEHPWAMGLSLNFSRLLFAGGLLVVLKIAFDAVIGIFRGVATFVKSTFGLGNTKPQSNAEVSMPGKRDIKLPRLTVSQLGNPPKDVQGDLAFNNTYKMYVEVEGKPPTTMGQILFIEGDLAVMPHHFHAELRRHIHERTEEYGMKLNQLPDKVHLVSCHRPNFNVTMSLAAFMGLSFLRVDGCDVMFVKFDRKMLKAHRSIVNMFLPEASMKQMLKNKTNHVRLDVARTGESITDLRRHTFVSNLCEYQEEPLTTVSGDQYSCTVSYNAPTISGDCGAPLSICEPRFWGGASIIGFHIAGKVGLISRKGFSSIITRELIQDARSNLGTWADNMVTDLLEKGIGLTELSPEELVVLENSGLIGGSQVPIGQLDKGLNVGGQSKIKPSPLYYERPWGPSPVRPSHLRAVQVDGVKVEPMARAMEAYQTPLEVDKYARSGGTHLEYVTSVAMRPHWEATKGYNREIMTFEEAVCPPENCKMKSLNRRTSAGYPYRLDGSVGKKDFFGNDGEFDFSSEACNSLRADVDAMVSKAKKRVRSSVVFTDFPKDELRPHAKVDDVATRAISGAPLDYVIAVRMYFGAFIAASFSTHTENGMAPGINPYTDWHMIADKLLSKGKKIFAGDFSRFDASEQPEVHEAILDYVNRWYKHSNPNWRPEDEVVRQILWLDLIHSRHLTGTGGSLNMLVQWAKSLPSGHPLTTLVNSMYALITLTACYIHLTKDHSNMWDNVQLITYGDDNVNSVTDAVADVFNQVTVADAMHKLFGLKYTSDKKGQDLVPYEAIEDVTFLKRYFVRDAEGSGGWIAPLDKASFTFIPYWFKNPRDPAGDLETNIKQMFSELCLYDQATWDSYYTKLENFAEREGLVLPFYSRSEARVWVMARTDAWY